MFAKLLSMLHSIGTAPYHFARGACNAPVIAPTFPTSQKAAQYTLRVVPGGLSLISIFINVAALALLALCHEEFIEVNDGANVTLAREQVTIQTFPAVIDKTICKLNMMKTEEMRKGRLTPHGDPVSNSLIPMKVAIDKEHSAVEVKALVGRGSYLDNLRHLLTHTLKIAERHD